MDLSAYNLSLTLGGVYLGGTDYNVIVLGREDPGFSGIKRTYYEIPGRDGGEVDAGYLQPVKWTVPCRIHAASESEVRSRLESILYLMQSDEDQQLIFDSRPEIYWMVSAIEPAQARWDAAQSSMLIDLVFQLSDPTGYAVTETEQVFTVTSDPQTFSVLSGSLENGSVAPWPTWILEAGESAIGFSLTNNTTGQAFSDTTDLTTGDMVKLDSKLQEKFTGVDGIAWDRDNSGGSGTVPRLKPRVTNSVTVTGIADATLTLRYRERFAAVIR